MAPVRIISLHASADHCTVHASRDGRTVIAAELPLPGQPAGGVVEWVHVLPAGEIVTHDGRGPYVADNLQAIAELSLRHGGGKLAIDENHSTDLAAPKGGPSPALGWITQFEVRDDGLWARVEWNRRGRELLADKAYSGISPVFIHDEDGRVRRILRASLTNTPNLRDLATLHTTEKKTMDMMKRLRMKLKLAEDADEEAIFAALEKLMKGAPQGYKKETLAAEVLAPVLQAAGLPDDATAAELVNAITSLKVTSVSEVAALQAQVTALHQAQAKAAAEAFVDAAIRDGRVGVKGLRDHYIARHMSDAKNVEIELAALPKLGGGELLTTQPPEGGKALSAAEADAAKALGIAAEDFIASRNTLTEKGV